MLWTLAIRNCYCSPTGTPERPWAVAQKHGNVNEIFWYGTYEQLPFDQKLFAKPAGMKIEEVK